MFRIARNDAIITFVACLVFLMATAVSQNAFGIDGISVINSPGANNTSVYGEGLPRSNTGVHKSTYTVLVQHADGSAGGKRTGDATDNLDGKGTFSTSPDFTDVEAKPGDKVIVYYIYWEQDGNGGWIKKHLRYYGVIPADGSGVNLTLDAENSGLGECSSSIFSGVLEITQADCEAFNGA